MHWLMDDAQILWVCYIVGASGLPVILLSPGTQIVPTPAFEFLLLFTM